jgi:hypothetical protein
VQYEIRPMSFGEILDMGFQIVRNNFVQLVAISAIVQVPLAIVQSIAADTPPGGQISTSMAIGFAIAGLGFLVVGPFAQVAITFAIGENYQGRTTTVGRAFQEAIGIVLPLLGTSLLSGLLALAGFVLFVIPGVWVVLGQTVLSQVMIFERRFGTNGIKRSFELMKGQRGRAFGIILLATILIGVLGFAFGLVGRVLPFAGPIASGLASAVGTTFLAAVAVVLYFDIRCRKEAFEIEHLARLVSTSARPAA